MGHALPVSEEQQRRCQQTLQDALLIQDLVVEGGLNIKFWGDGLTQVSKRLQNKTNSKLQLGRPAL